ncbi:hypothetical protein OAV88_00650 [bacterium]|nr:hypothetical protein [bacterium]
MDIILILHTHAQISLDKCFALLPTRTTINTQEQEQHTHTHTTENEQGLCYRCHSTVSSSYVKSDDGICVCGN